MEAEQDLKMISSRRKFFSSQLVILAGSNKIDEQKIVDKISESIKSVEAINDLLDQNMREDVYREGEYAEKFKEFRSGISDLLFVLDGLFFSLDDRVQHIELNWAKSYADSFDATCGKLLRMLDNPDFLNPIFEGSHPGVESAERVKKDIAELRQAIQEISSDYSDIQLIRRSNAEEEALWDEYTKDVADPDEDQTLQEQLRDMMLFYIEKYGRSGDFEREFMQSGISNTLKGLINRTHARIMNGLEEYLKLSGGVREKKLAMKTAISSLLGNPRTYMVLKDNEDFQRWLEIIEIFNNYLPSA